MRRLPAPRRDHAAQPARASARAGATRSAAATCSAPTSSTSPRCCWRCRSCCSRRWPRRSSASPSCSACSTPPRPSAPCSRPRSRAGPRGSTTTAGRSWSRRRRTALFIALAGLAPTIWRGARLFFVLAGAADMISAVFRGTVWNQTIPEQHARPAGRHRDAVVLRRPARRPGARRRGGGRWSVRGAIVSGGVACVAGVGSPPCGCATSGRTTTRTDEHAVAERELRAARGEKAD